MILLSFNFHVGIVIFNKNGLHFHKAQPVSSFSGGLLFTQYSYGNKFFRSPIQYYFVKYEHELCIKTIKTNTQKRTIYFRMLFYIFKSVEGDIACQTITVEAVINY